MNFGSRSVRFKWSRTAVLAMCCALALPLLAKEKEKPSSAQVVDSGSFGVYSAGHRVGTETFSIRQDANGSVVSSEFKSEQGEQKAVQSSELVLTPSVELKQYTWKETLPEKNEAVVQPSDAFLVEHYGPMIGDKQAEQSFLLPASTTILDDYFFVHREILAWKYLKTSCPPQKGVPACPLKSTVQFGTLNPNARSSMAVSIEFSGREKLTIHGVENEFSRFVLRSESGDWAFWLDDQLKLVRMLAENGTEVLRD